MSAGEGHSLEAQLLFTAAKYPDIPAVIEGNEATSYSELFEQARRIARLVELYGANNGVVAVQAARGRESITGLLGVLLAGATYVALDPAQPQRRLRDIVHDCEANLLLLGNDQQTLGDPGRPVARLGSSDLLVSDHSLDAREASEAVRATRSDIAPPPAYLVYTSGSTGKPKGVIMSRPALWGLIKWHLSQQRDPGYRTAQFAAVGFDVAIQEVLSTLCAAGTLIVFGDEVRQDARTTIDRLAAMQVHRLFTPTALLRSLSLEGVRWAAENDSRPLRLREVICAGEQLLVSAAERKFFAKVRATLHNHYGPAETHVVTALTLSGDPDRWPAEPGIGKPLPGVLLKTSDSASGTELLIGGPRLSDGYLNRPEETAERFVMQDGNRWYRTGDLVSRAADGWHYRGRLDSQMKISGYRIEPAEVEVCLLGHPDVTGCAVDAVTLGDARLLRAHVVIDQSAPIVSDTQLRSELIARCREHLPPHMTITVLRLVDQIPVSVNGKIDRAALAAVPPPSTPIRFAGNKAHEVVPAVVASALGLDCVEHSANFFDIGATSILIKHIRTELIKILGYDIPLTALYEHSTISRLVAYLDPESETGPRSAFSTEKRSAGLLRRAALRHARIAARQATDD